MTQLRVQPKLRRCLGNKCVVAMCTFSCKLQTLLLESGMAAISWSHNLGLSIQCFAWVILGINSTPHQFSVPFSSGTPFLQIPCTVIFLGKVANTHINLFRTLCCNILWMGQRNPNHQLIDGKHPIIYRVSTNFFPLFIGFQHVSTILSAVITGFRWPTA